MKRLEAYFNEDKKSKEFKDFILFSLEQQQQNIYDYLDGAIIDIILNKKKYKIFQIEKISDLSTNILNIEANKIKPEIISNLKKEKGVEINKVIGGHRIINKAINEKIDDICNYVIHNYNLNELFKKESFIDIVFNDDGYKIAPLKVGRPTEKEKEIRLNVRITENQYNNLKEYAEKNKLSISKAIRNLLEYL